jgi:hypothetical protein
MAHRIRALAGVLTIVLAAGCVSAAYDRRATSTPEPPPVVVATIADHPPITASGVIASFDPSTDVFRFEDGRLVKLTGRSTVLASAANAIRIGDPVVLQDVLPVGVYSGFKMLAGGRPQRMGTVATVDEERGLLQMADGTLVRVTRTTNLHLGAASSSLTLTQVNPGDELIVVFSDTTAEAAPAEHATTYSSALPRQDVSPLGVEAGEVMIFRTSRKP